jgi:NADPH-dependent curcumin reductase CurA
MTVLVSREIQLKRRPVGAPAREDFDEASVELREPGPGEVLVRNSWMSVDPYIRLGMSADSEYVPAFELGRAIPGYAVGEVVVSRDESFSARDLVLSQFGWREGFVAPASELRKLPRIAGVPDQAYLGVLGTPGRTAYGGFVHLANPRSGETVFVSGAAGAVGSMVCQLAKLKGCTVIASVGSAEKAEWLRMLGVDHVINYRTAGNLKQAVSAAAQGRIDIYFDNVAGEHLEVALELAVPFARFVACGMISTYNDASPRGPRNLLKLVSSSITIYGFSANDLFDRHPELMSQFTADVGRWVVEKRIQWKETVEVGIGNAPQAFLKLFCGENTGKMLVKL